MLLSLPRTGQQPRALSTRDIARIVGRHAEAAGLPEDRRTPHVLGRREVSFGNPG